MTTDNGYDRPVAQIGLSRVEAAAALSMSPRSVDALMADRTSGFPFAKIRGRVVIPTRELTEWLAAQIKGGDPQR